MVTDDDSFFSRWSRRKAQDRAGQAVPAEAPPTGPSVAAAPLPATPAATHPATATAATPATAAPAAEPAQPPPSPPLPTLDDVQALTPASDFSRFVARGVPADVRNAAVKKLFADPHFNVMDGLDIYIDDYSKTEPIPAAMMANMVSAQFLKLVDEPKADTESRAEMDPDPAATAATAPDPCAAALPAEAAAAPHDTRATDAAASPETTRHDHADLQLQPDHAPRPEGPGAGAG